MKGRFTAGPTRKQVPATVRLALHALGFGPKLECVSNDAAASGYPAAATATCERSGDPMIARFSLMADAANISTDGKVNILGEFNVIHARVFPVVHASLCYVASLEIGTADRDQVHSLELRYVDGDGEVIAPPIMMEFHLGPQAQETGETTIAPIIVPIQGFAVPDVGRFCLDLWWQGRQLSSCHFNAMLRVEPASA